MKEVFDRVKTHLLAQGERSQQQPNGFQGDGCAYHGANGLKCAVGCLITEEAYSKMLEGDPVEVDLVRAALVASGIVDDFDTIDMLRRLQRIHDCFPPTAWEGALDDLETKLFKQGE